MVNEFAAPTRENSALWASPEKDWFQPFLDRHPYNEDYSIHLLDGHGVPLQIWVRFYVTSYNASIYTRTCDCPEAFKDPSLVPTDKWRTVAKSHWGQNGSGFNQKYIEARRLIDSTAKGDWVSWCPLVQENRSTSYSFGEGESTLFWTAELTSPMLAQEKLTYPLTVCSP